MTIPPLTSSSRIAVIVIASILATVGEIAIAARAQTTSATAPPSTAPTTPPASDPCGGPTRLLATLDRPTTGFSACVVPQGAVVFEEGYQNTSQGGRPPGVVTTLPMGFERFGVGDRIELDVVGPTFDRSRFGPTLATGTSDLGLGFKYELPQAGRFTYALDGIFLAATGTGGFGAGAPTTIANLDVAYALSPAVGIAATVANGVTSGTTSDGALSRFAYVAPSLVVSAQIPNAYQFYAEVVAATRQTPDGGARTSTDFGIQKLLGPNLETDVEYGRNFTPKLSRFQYVGFGVGVRVR